MTIKVAILGSTGVVGQKLIALLQRKPQFEIIEMAASDLRIGKTYSQSCDWREVLTQLPTHIGAMKMVSMENISADFVLSCLPSEVAIKVEPIFAAQGKIVFSNASALRMQGNVPLLVPEINEDHLTLLNEQPTTGKIITNPNCSAVGVTLALAPLVQLAAIKHVSIVTLQSVSGAGYPGIPSLDILGNTVPHIEGEASKITEETKKILGSAYAEAEFAVTTHVHRVPVLFGHTATLHITFENNLSTKDVLAAYNQWNTIYKNLFIIHDINGRPQAVRDLLNDDMSVHIGHIIQGGRPDIIGLNVLTHNLVRGAAGAVISNIESYLRNY